MNKILLKVSAWTLCVSHVEMLFHSFVASLLPLVIFIVESVLSPRVILLANIVYGVNFMLLILGTWNLLKIFCVGEVWLITVSHRDSIKIVIARVWGRQTWLYSCVLVGYVFVKPLNAWWHVEAVVIRDWEFCVLVVSVWLRWIIRARWRSWTSEVYVSSREPRQLCPGVQIPGRLILLIRDHDPFSSHLRQIVVCRTGLIQICVHGLDYFFVSSSISDSPLEWVIKTRVVALRNSGPVHHA